MDLQIEPETFPKVATRININISVVLNERAIVTVSFFEKDSEFKILDTKVIYIDGEEYRAWGNDDAYMNELIFNKLGLKKKGTISNEDLGIVEPT